MSSIVERVCRHARLPIETADAVVTTLERTGSVAEAVFCLRVMGLDPEGVAEALYMREDEVRLILRTLPIASLLQAGVCA